MLRMISLTLVVCATLPAENFVRPFSAGGTLSLLPIGPFAAKEVHQIYSPLIENNATGENKSRFYGGGVTFQAAFAKRYAISGNVTLRSVGYRLNIVGLIGIDRTLTDPNATDNRTGYTTTEETRARYWDVPILLRRFSRNHNEGGWRWFAEAGPTFRRVSNIRTSIQIDANSKVTCCDETPATPSHTTIPGITLGGGLHLIDDYGIRMIPEFRYTRWLARTFDNLAAPSRRDQIELLLSFTF